MTRIQPLFLALVGAALIGVMPIAGEAQITVSLPELTGQAGEAIDIPVTTDDLSGQGVTAYFFTMTFDSTIVEIERVAVEGTLSERMTVAANTDLGGEIAVAASGIDTLQGGGILLNLKAVYVGRGSTGLNWSAFLFNEGDPEAVAVDGQAVVTIGSETGIQVGLPEAAGLVGERVSLPISTGDLTGQGVFAYQFTLAYDPNVLRIEGISTGGTVSAEMAIEANVTVPGRLRVAASQDSPLEGGGVLLNLEVEYAGGGDSPLRWVDFSFNERDPAPNPTDGSARANGEIVFNEVHSGPASAVDWVEMAVMADHLDLRGYRVSGADGQGFTFAGDPLWEDLRRGTLILVGGNDAPLADDADPGDFVISVRNDPHAPSSLLAGDLLDIQADADAVQIVRPSEEPVFAVVWGGAGPVGEFRVDLGIDPLPAEVNLAFQGGNLAGVTDANAWETVEGAAGTPRQGNGPLNLKWIAELRGGAEVVDDIGSGEIEVTLPAISGQVGRTTLAPVRIGEVTGRGMLSYFFAVDYDPQVVKIAGVSTGGTLSEEMTVLANAEEVPGRVTVAASGTKPLEGAGTLIDLQVEYVGPGATELRWAELQIDEGEPRSLGIDGRAEARVGTASGIGVRLPETTGSVGQTVSWPVEIEDVSGRNVMAYLFGLAYDPRVVAVTGVSAAGTISAGMTVEVNTETPGQVTVAASQTGPLSGSGILLELQAEYVGRGTAELIWTNFTFNEGEIEAAPIDGRLTVQNAPLRAVDDELEVAEDTPTTLEVLANDADLDGDPLVIIRVTEPERGAVAIDPDSVSLTYTPLEDYNGPDSFTYEVGDRRGDTGVAAVAIQVTPVNDPPVGVDNETTTLQDSALTIFVLANDLDVDGDRLAIDSVTQPGNGTVAIDPGSISITYTPNPGFRGQDSFTYTLVDGQGGSAAAGVVVEVVQTNVAPVAVDDAAETEEDTPVGIQVLDGDTDADGDELTVIAVSDAASGTVALDQASGAVTYVPAENFHGEDTFTYTISDPKGATATGTVTVTVTPVNDPPMAMDDTGSTAEDTPVTLLLLANDDDLDGDTLTVTAMTPPTGGTAAIDPGDTTVTYTPTADFHGQDAFTYTIDDGQGGTSTAIVRVTVTPVNDPPVAVDDAAATDEDVPMVLDLLANDADADGETPRVTGVGDPANGAAALGEDGATVTYTPAADFHGEDRFTYTIEDADGATATGTVTVTVIPVNDTPVAVDDAAETDQEKAAVVAVLDNDSDVDGEQPSLSSVGQPQYGTAGIDAAGSTVIYTPETGFSGEDSFTYTIVDGSGASGAATVRVTVKPEQILPALVSSSPADGETGLEVDLLNDAGLVFVFSEPIAADGVQVAVQSDGQGLDWMASWSAGDTRLTLRPAAGSELGPGVTYQVALTQVLDLKGNDAGAIEIGFETRTELAGDVNADGVVDVRDAILTLRLAAGLPLSTPPAGHVEPTPYERRTADVSGDGAIDEADALLTLGAALERIATKPTLTQAGPAVLRWGEMSEAGGELTVPVRVGGNGEPHAGRIDLRYGAGALELLEVSAGKGGGLMVVDDRRAGELGISLVHLDGLPGAGGAVVRLRFRVCEGLREEGWMRLEGARLFDAEAGRLEVEQEEAILRLVPRAHALFQNAPNPFNPSTEIRFQLPAPGAVRLVVYDLLGRTVRVLIDGHREAGHHLVAWDGRDEGGRPAGSGVYLLRLESGDFAQVRKMILMR